jgi:hypothetical protein
VEAVEITADRNIGERQVHSWEITELPKTREEMGKLREAREIDLLSEFQE